MSEGKRVLAGEAILSGLATIERGMVESRNDALEALVREHSRLVYRVAYAVLRSHPDAEDATQETFLRVLRYSSKLAEVEEPKTWLARIAWRVAVDRSKRRSRTREVALEDPEEPIAEAASPDTAADETLHGAEVSARRGADDSGASRKVARAAGFVGDGRDVAQRNRGHLGDQ